MITNAGNKLHERMLALIQQDLARLGIQLNVVVLDFPSLIERISRTFNYESVLMAWTNIDLDPSAQMNIWLSSAANHQWNPNEKAPETAWEAEIDKLMQAQNASQDPNKRKADFDQVQQIVADQAPILFLVNPNALSAVSPNVKNVTPAVLSPQILLECRPAASGRDPRKPAMTGLLKRASRWTTPTNRACCATYTLISAKARFWAWWAKADRARAPSRWRCCGCSNTKALPSREKFSSPAGICCACAASEMRQIRGRDIALVLQSPLASLNPALRIGTQMAEAWRAHIAA